MCQRTTCRTCGKPTYVGCGRHVEAVLGDVPPDQRCTCRETAGGAAGNSPGARPWWKFWR